MTHGCWQAAPQAADTPCTQSGGSLTFSCLCNTAAPAPAAVESLSAIPRNSCSVQGTSSLNTGGSCLLEAGSAGYWDRMGTSAAAHWCVCAMHSHGLIREIKRHRGYSPPARLRPQGQPSPAVLEGAGERPGHRGLAGWRAEGFL